ncbi:MAG: GatB/YqeY domain-containing protein, partial [Pseudomonadota bacterium]
DDLIAQEQFEVELIQTYLPAQLSDAEIDTLIDEAVQATGAASIKDMGKLMGTLKPKLAGRADMGAVSQKIKAKLAG